MKKYTSIFEGIIYDTKKREKFEGKVVIEKGLIVDIKRCKSKSKRLILPGFVDSHIHIESSMLTPDNFSRTAIKHGTIAVVADPHEIANVGGMAGINYFINNAKEASLKIFFGAPSCVPASPIDDCFCPLGTKEVIKLLKRKDFFFLSEMMNFPGVINSSSDVMEKIKYAQKVGKPIDGHAPGLTAQNLIKYVSAGISTDHECFTLIEATEKINLGMKILIREGSAAKNYDSLHPLIKMYPKLTMFCTDDCHPDDLLNGHINSTVIKSLKLGYDIFDIIQIASVNPVEHYKLKVGLLQVGDPADFIIVDNLSNFNVQQTIINGRNVIETPKRSLNP